MDFTSFRQIYCEIFQKNNLNHFCTDDLIRKFYDFTQIFTEENSHTNLTAIREIPDIIAKHYADCLIAEHLFPKDATVMDIGCGGGFPTIPLAIVRPDLQIIAIDSTQKKINFVQQAANYLQISNIIPICDRAESDKLSKYREKADVVTSRAMARMNILTELTLPFVKIGGQLIALKGMQGSTELEEAKSAISTLGGNYSQAKSIHQTLQTPNSSEERYFLVVTKEKASPTRYPRNYSSITKKPL